jgi:short subunit dehydrogenase-like uncharacterized protein
MPTRERAFDVVLFGATGFTGRLVAEYMAEHAERAGVRWAIAGRNREKLEAVKADLQQRSPKLAELPIRVADSLDVAALDALVPDTRVICTTVGPYAKYGKELVAACARHGVSYCDLSGESTFVRAMIDQHHETARTNHTRIVTSSGFDSIPSDLGTFVAWDYARRTHGEDLSWVKVFVGKLKGAASGGTFASGLALLDEAKKSRAVRRLLRDPHGLDPTPWHGPRDPFEDDQRGVRFDADVGRWTAPFVMAAVNTRIVRRSHGLFREAGGAGYGKKFRYHEAMSFRAGPRGLLQASILTAGIGLLLGAATMPPTRHLLERAFLPAPGEGPSREAIERGCFELHVLARTESGRHLRGRVVGTRDPGYGETAKMLSESAFCLAKDADRLDPRYGVLTPATAMGLRLVERLRAAGMTFEVGDAA